jgi:signal recognition particle GTPase
MKNSLYSIIKIDESFKKVFEQFGLPPNRAIKQDFESLAKIIIGQQISTNIAKSLSDKLKKDGMLTEKKNMCRQHRRIKTLWVIFSKSILPKKFSNISN